MTQCILKTVAPCIHERIKQTTRRHTPEYSNFHRHRRQMATLVQAVLSSIQILNVMFFTWCNTPIMQTLLYPVFSPQYLNLQQHRCGNFKFLIRLL